MPPACVSSSADCRLLDTAVRYTRGVLHQTLLVARGCGVSMHLIKSFFAATCDADRAGLTFPTPALMSM